MNPPCKLVNEQWIVGCYSFVQRISTRCYPVRGIDQLRERLQNPQASRPSEKAEKKESGEKASKETSQAPPSAKQAAVDPDLEDVLEEIQDSGELEEFDEEFFDATFFDSKSNSQTQTQSQSLSQTNQSSAPRVLSDRDATRFKRDRK